MENVTCKIGGLLIIGLQQHKKPEDVISRTGCKYEYSLSESLPSVKWKISNKYYDADIVIYALREKKFLWKELSADIQAIIMYFDSFTPGIAEELDNWLQYIDYENAQIHILLCDSCSFKENSGLTKTKAQEWCLKNRFELIELNTGKDPDSDLDTASKEHDKEGIDRLVEALHAHVWPNLNLHGNRKTEDKLASGLNASHNQPDKLSGTGSDKDPSVTGNVPTSGMSSRDFLNFDVNSDFESLLANVTTIRNTICNMPFNERRKLAEDFTTCISNLIEMDSDEDMGPNEDPGEPEGEISDDDLRRMTDSLLATQLSKSDSDTPDIFKE